MMDARLEFALRQHYKAERERAECCLSDILAILCDAGCRDDEQLQKITERLTKHYER